jgi:hypothetical protein
VVVLVVVEEVALHQQILVVVDLMEVRELLLTQQPLDHLHLLVMAAPAEVEQVLEEVVVPEDMVEKVEMLQHLFPEILITVEDPAAEVAAAVVVVLDKLAILEIQ